MFDRTKSRVVRSYSLPPEIHPDADHRGTRVDITPDGTHVVFDRSRQNADVVLIDRPATQAR